MSSPNAVKRAYDRAQFRKRIQSGPQLAGWRDVTLGQWPLIRHVQPVDSAKCKLVIAGPDGPLYTTDLAYPTKDNPYGYATATTTAEEEAVLQWTGWTERGRQAGARSIWYYEWGPGQRSLPHPFNKIRALLGGKVVAAERDILLFAPRTDPGYIAAIVRHDPVRGLHVDYKVVGDPTIFTCDIHQFADSVIAE